ncbi:MAG TPA: NAD(P)H-dependent glycerol-3-phosphate dehydrogenase [Gammaproteobacteria bacterium]
MSDVRPIAVLGAGSWGTALAIQLARAGRPTVLWARDAEQVRTMRAERRNPRYLPDAPFPEALEVTADFAAAVGAADDVLIVVPSHAFRATLEALRALARPPRRLAWATKGFELETGLLPHRIAAELLPPEIPTAVLSGPTFAREVAAGLPSAMTIASEREEYAADLARSISTDSFRAYTSTDIVGVEVGAATKNVYAIGAGISDGLGFGANTRIALVTRGLAEMTRLGLALGARMDTFMGLAGIGDLVLTCTDDQSRNRRFGLALARGVAVQDALREIGQVVEGYYGARSTRLVAARLGVDMPIVEQIHGVLYRGIGPRAAVAALMRRPLAPEQRDPA